jgi:hypothetical protein
MQDVTRFALAANLKWLLAGALALLALMLLHACWRSTLTNFDKLRHWTRHPAEVVSTADELTLELEISEAAAAGIPGVRYAPYPSAYREGNTRILFAREGGAVQPSNGATVLLQDPANPARVALHAPIAAWLPVAVNLICAFVLLLLARWVLGNPWGEDINWVNGAWVATDTLGTPPGARAEAAQVLHETRGSRLMPLFWSALFGGLLLSGWLQMPAVRPFYAPLPFLLVGALFTLALYALVEAWTRQLGFDDSGIAETTFFGARRVAWAEIGRVQRRNLSEEAQQRWDRERKRSGSRPQTVYVQELLDANGSVIFKLSEELAPRERYAALLARAAGHGAVPGQRVNRTAAPGIEEHDEGEEDEEPLTPAEAAEIERLEADWAARNASHSRTMRLGWLAVISPFLLVTLWLGWKAAYFRFAAERTEGLVTSVEGGELRSLTVQYRDASGDTHRIESDGTRANARFDVGDPIRVFYRADHPQDARLDQFLELWLSTLISAGITALVALPLLFMRG